MLLVRYGIPGAMALAGVVAMVVAPTNSVMAAAGVVLVVFGLMVWLLGYLYRMSISSNADREREEEAREHFARTGRWPDGR